MILNDREQAWKVERTTNLYLVHDIIINAT